MARPHQGRGLGGLGPPFHWVWMTPPPYSAEGLDLPLLIS